MIKNFKKKWHGLLEEMNNGLSVDFIKCTFSPNDDSLQLVHKMVWYRNIRPIS